MVSVSIESHETRAADLSHDPGPDKAALLRFNNNPKLRHSLSRWKWELLWMVLSLSSLAACITLLATQDGRRVDAWSAFFTLNTFISILAQVSRTALAFGISASIGQAKWNFFSTGSGSLALFDAFDQASKGPWGSVGLAYRLQLRNLATLGAILIIILLSYEPFLQATITQYGELDGEPSGLGSRAYIGRSKRLDVGVLVQAPNPVYPSPIYENLVKGRVSIQADFGLTNSIYNGFYTSTSQDVIPFFTCPTGNCTFGVFSSLGVCSTCADVSSHLTRRRGSGGIPGSWFLLPQSHNESRTYTDQTYTSYSLSSWSPVSEWSTLTLSNYDGLRSTTDGAKGYDGEPDINTDTLTAIQATVFPEGSIYFNNTINSTVFVVFQIIQSGPGFLNNVSDWATTLPTATECGLYFCTKIFSSSVKEGTLNEDLLGTWSNRDPTSYQVTDAKAAYVRGGWDEAHNYSLFIGERDYPRTDLQIFIPDDEALRAGLPEEQPRRFNISQATIMTTASWIWNKFAADQMKFPVETLYKIESFRGTANDGAGQVIGNSTNLNATFRAVANSMTAYMRDLELETFPQHGTSETWVWYFRVRWVFAAPPLVFTVAGCLFLAYVIWETHSLGMAAWKDSTLATLAHGLDALTRAKLREAYQNGAEEKSAREITAKVEKSWGGFELCETYPVKRR
ncbi:hypothetical protein F5Y14DRAFT_428140 [Nemania sp. NC0429]|nr:hypothetical protein F5Y14DRAFT_428140 [Nemania sp. NC0429]